MFTKSWAGIIVPEVSQNRFGSIKEGVHIVTIKDAKNMYQNDELDLADVTAKIVFKGVKSLAKAHPAFNQDITSIVFQLKGGLPVIVDRRSNCGWAKFGQMFWGRFKDDVKDPTTGVILHKKGDVKTRLTEEYVDIATGEVYPIGAMDPREGIMLNEAFVNKHGLILFDGKYYLPVKSTKDGKYYPEDAIGIENSSKEQSCEDFMLKVYSACGLAGQEVNPASLIGKELKIKVDINTFAKPGDKFGRYKVTDWYPVTTNVSTTVEKATVVAEEPAEVPANLPF